MEGELCEKAQRITIDFRINGRIMKSICALSDDNHPDLHTRFRRLMVYETI